MYDGGDGGNAKQKNDGELFDVKTTYGDEVLKGLCLKALEIFENEYDWLFFRAFCRPAGCFSHFVPLRE